VIGREEIASKATPRFRYPIEPPVRNDDVFAAASGIESATNLIDLKVLAYAIHVGAMEPDEALHRLGDPCLVLETMRSMLEALPAIESERMAETLSHGTAGYHGRVFGNNQEEGWALTLFDMLHDCRFAKRIDVFGSSDPARIGVRWAVQGILTEEEASCLVGIWAAKGDALHIAAAGFLVLASVDTELGGHGSMVNIAHLPRLPRAIIGGRVLGDLYTRRRNSYQTGEFARRREDLIDRLKIEVPKWVEVPEDIRKFVHSGVRNEQDLVSFLLTLPLGERLRRVAGTEADELLKHAFQRVQTRAQLDERELMYVAGWMINPLAHAAVSIRMSVELFHDLLDNLAFDEYAHDFDYTLYLNDRPRAILLSAIGAIASVENSEPDLAAEARAAADVLRKLPAGVGRFGDDFVAELESRYGLVLPTA
jgi:hypothetical protein